MNIAYCLYLVFAIGKYTEVSGGVVQGEGITREDISMEEFPWRMFQYYLKNQWEIKWKINSTKNKERHKNLW